MKQDKQTKKKLFVQIAGFKLEAEEAAFHAAFTASLRACRKWGWEILLVVSLAVGYGKSNTAGKASGCSCHANATRPSEFAKGQ